MTPARFTGSKGAVNLSWWRRAVFERQAFAYPPGGSPWLDNEPRACCCAGQRAGWDAARLSRTFTEDPSATQRAECQALAIRPAIRCVKALD